MTAAGDVIGMAEMIPIATAPLAAAGVVAGAQFGPRTHFIRRSDRRRETRSDGITTDACASLDERRDPPPVRALVL
jgi:hypothetical protein